MQDFLKYRWGLFLICFVSLQFSVSGQNKEGEVRIETSAHVDEMLAQKKDYNKSLESYKGFKIQIYYGSEKECYELKNEFSSLFPDIATSIIFSTPQWKLQVGNYRTRLDADRAIINIKKEYPGAIVLATEIEIE
ncbi:SPOR domain-containing protein [Lutimonas zeaxanthinifaciens]|uniref:SPOR domain-containing protein n=1 Tax=Lutimonas zeaxanthinifaciens TaxID=3060215 RepID=UPI00265CB63A|nr:SPOR domain-containing protein [Lutimonas sp. YSD2104]WKK65423.1 SPOR domain-containing protein [Lutimonas sp. YSD2104]